MLQRYPYWLPPEPVSSPEELPVTDKFSGAVVSQVALAGPDAIEAAIAAGYAARDAMRRLPAFTRKEILLHAARRFKERAEELAGLLAVEAGKPLRDARGEVTRLIE